VAKIKPLIGGDSAGP